MRSQTVRRALFGIIGLAMVTAAIGIPACVARVAYVWSHPDTTSSWWRL